MSRFRFAGAMLLALVLMLFPLACSDSPTGFADAPAELVMTASVVGTPISTLVIEITAPDITTPIVYNLTVVNGIATGTLKMPPGENRLITVRAYDNTGEITHEGSKTTDVRPGNGNPALSIPMTARSGHVDITIQLGSVSIVIDPANVTLEENETVQLTATITAANGDVLDVTPAWATTNPAFATVNGSGLVTGVLAGSAGIVASYAGIAVVTPVNVTETGQVQLTVTTDGSGTGTVSSLPTGINCGSVCAASFAPNVPITLTATAATGSSFSGWTGGGCSGTGTCIVSLAGATTVTATFGLASHTLSVTRSGGSGNETVTSSPGGIACGLDCSEAYPHGTAVTLTAPSTPSYPFLGWSGGGCSGTGSCVVTLTGSMTVNAAFGSNVSALTVVRAGTGQGTVSSFFPGGINCGSDCTENYPPGTTVTLTASPAAGSIFTGWTGGGCSGTGSCLITMPILGVVTATFTLQTQALTVARAGSGFGTITSAPAGINCGIDCQEAFNHGTTVTLTAAPGSFSTFSGWSGGGCSGTGTCTVTMSAATHVQATFTLVQHTLTITKVGTGSGVVETAFTPAGINCGGDCTESYPHGTSVTLVATPFGGSYFAGWLGGPCTGDPVCIVPVNSPMTLTAIFNFGIPSAPSKKVANAP